MVLFFRSFPVRNVARSLTSMATTNHFNLSLASAAVNRLSMGLHTGGGGSGVTLVNKLASCICQEDALADLEALLVNPPQPFLLVSRGGNVVTMLASSLCTPLLRLRVLVRLTLPPQVKVDTAQAELQVPFEAILINQPQQQNQQQNQQQQPPGHVLVASCVTQKDGAFDINTVQFVPTDGLPTLFSTDSDEQYQLLTSASFAEALHHAYAGPELGQLPEPLQDAVAVLLQAAGVTPLLCQYLQAYAKAAKEPQEYRQWLRAFHKCVA